MQVRPESHRREVDLRSPIQVKSFQFQVAADSDEIWYVGRGQ